MMEHFIYFSLTIYLEIKYFLGRYVSCNISPTEKLSFTLLLYSVSHITETYALLVYFVFLFVWQYSLLCEIFL